LTDFLLDTHVWLWLQTEPERVDPRTLRLLSDQRHGLWLSAASAWEIAIKFGLGKLHLPADPSAYVPDRLRSSDTRSLGVEVAHALHVATLPDLHRDPFDRLIVAQAQLLDLTIVTADDQLVEYPVSTIRTGD
jgi:PIN domain nuclease of toxin-antitoxin system